MHYSGAVAKILIAVSLLFCAGQSIAQDKVSVDVKMKDGTVRQIPLQKGPPEEIIGTKVREALGSDKADTLSGTYNSKHEYTSKEPPPQSGDRKANQMLSEGMIRENVQMKGNQVQKEVIKQNEAIQNKAMEKSMPQAGH